MVDLFFFWSTIAVHTFLLWLIIWRETSLMLRWLSTMLIARIFCDYILMTVPRHSITYFYLYYAFEIVGFMLFALSYMECKRMITKSFIGQAMLIYLIPETIHVSLFITHHWRYAIRCADVLRLPYLCVLLYVCGILYRRKGYYSVQG